MLRSHRVLLAGTGQALATVVGAFAFAGLLSFSRGSESNRTMAEPSLRHPEFQVLTAAQFGGLPQAPELNIGTDWLNTKSPLNNADLRGRIVLLDFWTLC